MCTVIFIPENNKKVFVSLRDESPVRPKAILPKIYNTLNMNYLAPKDALAGGTWIGVNEFRNVIILLNGAFENHQKNEKYILSRGIIVNQLLASSLPVIDWNLLEMNNIEPFTLVIWSENKLFQLVWDGEKKFRYLLDESIPHIFSSSTLYNSAAKIEREEKFNKWMVKHPRISKTSVLHFFETFKEKQNGFLMNRNELVKTLSYSFLELSDGKKATFNYYDFSTQSYQLSNLSLKTNSEKCLLTEFRIQKLTVKID